MEFSCGKNGTGCLPFASNFRIVVNGAGETDRLKFAISDSPVDTSALYRMKENTLQKIYNNFRGRLKYNVKLDSHSILDTI